MLVIPTHTLQTQCFSELTIRSQTGLNFHATLKETLKSIKAAVGEEKAGSEWYSKWQAIQSLFPGEEAELAMGWLP